MIKKFQHVYGVVIGLTLLTITLISSTLQGIETTKKKNPETVGIPGTELAIVHTSEGPKCYEYPKFYVIEAELTDSVGSDILVKFKKDDKEQMKCEYVVNKLDYEVKNEWAEYFFGISGNFMFLESSTGPDPRGLMIYDLVQRKKMYETSFSGPIVLEKDDKLLFWQETGEASKENCPDYEKIASGGLTAVIETKVILDLNNFTISATKETRCAARQ
jgi:hypothetical protein